MSLIAQNYYLTSKNWLQILVNYLFCHLILHIHSKDFVEFEIQHQEQTIASKQELGQEKEFFVSRLLLMSLERIKYVLSSYLHARLRKVSGQIFVFIFFIVY